MYVLIIDKNINQYLYWTFENDKIWTNFFNITSKKLSYGVTGTTKQANYILTIIIINEVVYFIELYWFLIF
jgi:hypothetical protein